MFFTKVFISILFIVFFSLSSVQAQEQFIWKKDKFNSTGGILLDPTHSLMNPNSWDINLIGVDIFIQNNYAYIPMMSLKDVYKESVKAEYNKTRSSYYLTSNIDILGPSVSAKLKINDREVSLGFFTRVRSMISGYGIDSGFGYNNFNTQNYNKPFQLGKAKVSGMNWSEIGLNIATRINDDLDKQLLLGLNMKYLLGFDAIYAYNNKPLGATVTENNISISDYDLEAGIASSYNFDQKNYKMEPKGKGIGADIGISYIKKKDHRTSDDEYLYDYKFNLAILDFGFIRFNGEKHSFRGNNLVDIRDSEYDNVKDPYHFFESLSTTVYGNSTTSKTGDSFALGLPTALSFGYQQSLSDTQYFSFLISQRVPIYKYALKRANNISIGYSVNKYAIGYGVSASMYEYKVPQLGAYLRLGPLYVGSDNILPIPFKQQRLGSADIFFGLKIYPFWDSEEKKINRKKCNC